MLSHSKGDLTCVRWGRWHWQDICVSTAIFVVPKIVQIKNKEEEEVKEELVTQAMMRQLLKVIAGLNEIEIIITCGRSGTETENR